MAAGTDIEISPAVSDGEDVHDESHTLHVADTGENHLDSGSKADSNNIPELLTVTGFRRLYHNKRCVSSKPLTHKLGRCVKAKCSGRTIRSSLLATFPVWFMLKTYNVRTDLVTDLVAGLSVGIVQIPSSMAFAMLAALPPICGLYTAFISAITYFLFGTSHYASVGTTATVSLIVGTAVENNADNFVDSLQLANGTTNATLSEFSFEAQQHKVATATALSFLVGLFLLILGKLRCGFVTSYMPDPMLGGFLTSAMILVIVSQLKVVLGLKIAKQKQPLKCFKELVEIGKNISSTNVASLISSIISFLILYIVKVCVNERFKDRLLFPVPIELIVLALSTTVSHFADLHEKFGVDIVGHIPSSLPPPQLPPIQKTNPGLILDSITVGLVAYVISVSIAKSLAKKQKETVNSNQEMVAVGASSLMTSFFSGFAVGVSLSRSMVQKSAGGKTQVSSLVGSLVVLLVIVFIGPLFYSLPVSVLAAIILVAFKSVITQLQRGKRHWSVSKYDFIMWMVTFVGVLFLGVDIGLCLGIGTSILSVVIRTQRSQVLKLGQIPSSNIYLPTDDYICEEGAIWMKTLYFEGPLYFANSELFVKRFGALVSRPEAFEHEAAEKIVDANELEINHTFHCTEHKGEENSVTENLSSKPTGDENKCSSKALRCVIIDCSAITFSDATGVGALASLITEYEEAGLTIYFAGVKDPLVENMERSGYWELFSGVTFVTVRGAEEHARRRFQSNQ